jgi:hypothetical protein
MTLSPGLLVVLCGFAPPAAAAVQDPSPRVWVVDDDGGPGVDFTALQPAVDVVRAGELVVVHAGRYAGFSVLQKSVDLLAAGDGPVEIAGVVFVQGNSGAEDLLIRGFVSPPTPPFFRFVGQQSVGRVWLEDCRLGPPAGAAPTPAGLLPAVSLLSCTSVALVRCELRGPSGLPAVGGGGGGLPALDQRSSNVWAYHSRFYGGAGHPGALGTGGRGGPAVLAANFELFLSGCELYGGAGGSGGTVGPCSPGGDGGDGIQTAQLFTNLWLHDTRLLPGPGGAGGCGAAAAGLAGLPVDQSSGQLTYLPGTRRGFVVDSPSLASTVPTAHYAGEPGDLVLTAAAVFQGTTQLFLSSGVALLSPPQVVVHSGPLPPSGSQPLPLLATAVPPTFEGLVLHLQTLFLDARGGAHLGPPSALAILR